jgi:hypothetical protein
MDTSEQQNVSEPLLRALLYGAPLFYAAVTAFVGLVFLEGIVSTAALVMAVCGAVLAYLLLKRTFESQYDITL